MRRFRWFSVTVMVLLLVVACGGGDDGGDEASGFPTGSWRNTCERGTVKVLDVRADGTFSLRTALLGVPLQPTSEGTWSGTGTSFTFETDSFCRTPAVYGWQWDGEGVRLSATDDACPARVATMDGYRFTPAAFPELTSSMIERGTAVEQVARRYEAAWAAHDLDAISPLLAEGLHFREPGREISSKERFLSFMAPYVADPDVGSTEPRFFVGVDEVLVVYETWGFAGITPASPVVEADLLRVREARITAIDAMYGATFLEMTGLTVPTELIDAHRAAWTGDPALIEDLYVPEATRSESLYAVDQQGREAIADFGEAWSGRHPEVALTIEEPFVFGNGSESAPVVGALLRLTDEQGCEVPLAVLLDGDGRGQVAGERVLYDLRAIVDCDWRR